MKKFYLFLVVVIAIFVSGCLGGTEASLVERGFQQILDDELVAAEASFDEVLRLNPDNAYALLNLGVVYENTNRIEKAKEMYNKVIQRNGNERAGKSNENEE